jgi:hypothetical protein
MNRKTSEESYDQGRGGGRGQERDHRARRVAAEPGKRHPWKGYRCEPPLASVHISGEAGGPAHLQARKGGWNFAGLHYTLWRHYDPTLMRFTTPDPIQPVRECRILAPACHSLYLDTSMDYHR